MESAVKKIIAKHQSRDSAPVDEDDVALNTQRMAQLQHEAAPHPGLPGLQHRTQKHHGYAQQE